MSLFAKKLCLILFSVFILLIFPFLTLASDNKYSCDNRFVTFVNPVRGRQSWFDKSLTPLKDQYKALSDFDFPATWLIQYDVLKDSELLSEIKSFDKSQEIGIFLEISSTLAKDSRVIYPYDAVWSAPNAVFTSGYPQSDRKKIIDKLFNDFKKEFGFYPKSIGAWWIDSFSLSYMKEKYGVLAAMIVADQKTTDHYGVWGQWWGMPFYPSKANILTPANNLANKQNVVVIQWAQRDPSQAFGEGPKFSNFSLQANDYLNLGQDTKFFKEIAAIYLNCQNPLGQITVGLETGMESVGNINEYRNQLKVLKETTSLKGVTMREFARKFAEVYPDFPKKVFVDYLDSKWIINTKERISQKSKESIKYNQQVAFSDYFLPDKSKFLDRRLPEEVTQQDRNWIPWFLLVSLGFGIFSYFRKIFKIWLISTLFVMAGYGLILKSHFQFGWIIFYGPKLQYLIIWQMALIAITFLLTWLIFKWNKLKSDYKNLLLISFPLVFGFDPLIKLLRYSFISGKHYLGIATDPLQFMGITYSKPLNIEFLNIDLPFYQAAALLRIDFTKIWESLPLSLVAYPLLHLILAFGFAWILYKLPNKIRMIVIVVMSGFFSLHLLQIYFADPNKIQPLL